MLGCSIHQTPNNRETWCIVLFVHFGPIPVTRARKTKKTKNTKRQILRFQDCCFHGSCNLVPECVARVPVSLGGLGVRLCSPKVAFATATVRNRRQPFATVGNRLRDRHKSSPQWRARFKGSRNCVKLRSCRRSYIGVCRGGV